MSIEATRPGARVTLRDVARAAGVHPGTVSRALNPDTRSLVNEQTVQRVTAVATELGYRANPMARGLKTNRSFTVGVLIPDIENPLFPPIARGIEDRLADQGYTPLITNTENDPERELASFEAMHARQVDGFITATAQRDHALLDRIVAHDVPLVLVNRDVEDGSLPAATVDDRTGAALAVRHLADLGHVRIAHLAGPQRLSTGHARRQGFVDAVRRAGLEADPALIPVADAFTEAEGARLCAQLLDGGSQFTAIVAGNDLMALGCYDEFAQRGIRCPEDIAVVGYNDMPFADRFSPPLTSVRIPHYEVGRAGAELLLERLVDPQAAPRQVRLEPSLVVRGSTSRAR